MAELKPDDPLVVEIVHLEKELAAVTSDPKFLEAVKAQQELNQRIAEGWKAVQGAMQLSHTKKLEGDWGYITLVPVDYFKGDVAEVPKKFIKKALDTKLIGDTYKLTGKLPKGIQVTTKTHLRKGINL